MCDSCPPALDRQLGSTIVIAAPSPVCGVWSGERVWPHRRPLAWPWYSRAPRWVHARRCWPGMLGPLRLAAHAAGRGVLATILISGLHHPVGWLRSCRYTAPKPAWFAGPKRIPSRPVELAVEASCSSAEHAPGQPAPPSPRQVSRGHLVRQQHVTLAISRSQQTHHLSSSSRVYIFEPQSNEAYKKYLALSSIYGTCNVIVCFFCFLVPFLFYRFLFFGGPHRATAPRIARARLCMCCTHV